MALIIIYWVIVCCLFIGGLAMVIFDSIKNRPTKPGLQVLLAAVILLVIGAGACAVMLSNLSINR